ncbi:MAG: hypothetical protein UT31_C0002G0009 [Parcubacteria group bacterium GW2011_GWF2_39_13b]|nr:MAG: hypothetical protein UT31_C0002G0009 [Parcubacteria group bacterium GW2011_GWF2_39_13b]
MTFDLEKVKKYCKKIMHFAGKYCWLLAAILFLAALAIAGMIFFKYAYPIFIENQEISAEPIKINQAIYGQIKNRLENSRQNLQDILNKDYQDPFN